MPRLTLDELLDTLRKIALTQLTTTEEGKLLLKLNPPGLVETLLEAVVRNQTSVVDMWIDIAINGE